MEHPGNNRNLPKLLNLIEEHPRSKELKESFGPRYLNELAGICSAKTGLKRLVRCLLFYGKLAEVDKKMDKEYFKHLVTSDFCMASGADKEGRTILWVRSGLHDKRIWSLQYGSPKALAHLRALIFSYQAAQAGNLILNSTFVVGCIYYDVADLNNLDFNLRHSSMYFKYCVALFPIPVSNGVVFGAGYSAEVALRLLDKMFPKYKHWTCVKSFEPEATYPFVEEVNSIPAYILQDICDEEDEDEEGDSDEEGGEKVTGTPYDEHNALQSMTWCYLRIYKEKKHLKASDVFNPKSCTKEEYHAQWSTTADGQTIGEARKASPKLGTISEDDNEEEDGEW